MADKPKNEMDEREIGALWDEVSKSDGKEFLTGTVNGQKIVVFKNKFKEKGDKKPSWRIYKSKEMASSKPAQDDFPD